MKKINKILAGICLCGVGVGALTGCSLSDSQQAAIDKLTNNVDTMVELVEKQSKELDKQKAFDLLKHAEHVLDMGIFNQSKIVMKYFVYDGVFDKLLDENTRTLYYNRVSKEDNINTKEIYTANTLTTKSEKGETESIIRIVKSDIENDKHWKWNLEDTFFESKGFSSGNYDSTAFLNFYDTIFEQSTMGNQIKLEDIVKIEQNKDGYLVKIFFEEDTKSQKQMNIVEYLVDFDGLLRGCEVKIQRITKGSDSPASECQTMVITFDLQYEDIDFTLVENKIAEIEKANLTK